MLLKYQLSVALIIVICTATFAQQDSAALNSIYKFQKELNAEYKNSETSPLSSSKLKNFTAHDYFPIDLKYRVEALLTVTENEVFFKMMTSNNQPRDYRQYGILSFTLEGHQIEIPVYQSQRLMGTEEYDNYLFLPFTDPSNGKTSYAAGRYIDLRIPESGNTLIVDFNKAYNPFCAYSNNYSCPVVPTKNRLPIEILAGVRFAEKH